MICTARFSLARVFMNTTSRFIAPASSITLIWKMLATTIRLIGKLATSPARLAISATSQDVEKNKTAMRNV